MTQDIPTVEEKSHSEEWGAWRFVSEMLSTPNPDPELARAGIYNTSKCYEQIHDFVVEQKRKAFEEGVKAERERILGMLSSQSIHAEAIYETLGAGHHYSTLPVIAGVVSVLKRKLTVNDNK